MTSDEGPPGSEPLPGLGEAIYDATEDERLLGWMITRLGIPEEAAREELANITAHLDEPLSAAEGSRSVYAWCEDGAEKPNWWAGAWPPDRSSGRNES
jgi:hypothetical protein